MPLNAGGTLLKQVAAGPLCPVSSRLVMLTVIATYLDGHDTQHDFSGGLDTALEPALNGFGLALGITWSATGGISQPVFLYV